MTHCGRTHTHTRRAFRSALSDPSSDNRNMSLFVTGAKTPDLFYVLLLLATARSSHAGMNATATTKANVEDPVTPTIGAASRPQTINGTTSSSKLNSSDTAHTLNQNGDAEATEGPFKGHAENTSSTVPGSTKTLHSTTVISTTVISTTAPKILTETHSSLKTSTMMHGSTGSAAASGSVILVLLLLAITGLAFLLYYLRKKSRSYSFDLFSPMNDQASDNTPLKPIEMETFQPKDTDTPAILPTVVIDSCDNHLVSPVANGSVEEEPGNTAADSGSTKSDDFISCVTADLSESGSHINVPEETTDVNMEEQPGNENNNNFTAATKAPELNGEDNFTEINLN